MPFSPRKKQNNRKKKLKKVVKGKKVKKLKIVKKPKALKAKTRIKAYSVKKIISKREERENEYKRAAVLFVRKHLPAPTIAANKACKKLRVTKRRLGRFIFIDNQGREIQRSKRNNYSRLKGYIVFISKKGKKKLIKSHTNIAGQPIAGFISDHNPFSAKVKVSNAAKARAKKYFLVKYPHEIEDSTTNMKTQYHTYTDIPIQGGKGAKLSYYDFADELSAKIATIANRIRASEHVTTVALVVEMHIKLYNKANKLEKIVPVNMPIIWCRAEGKAKIRRDYAFPVLISVGYSNMVEILNRMGIVLSGSHQYVNRLIKLKRATRDKAGTITYQRRYKQNGKYKIKVMQWKKQNYKPIELYSLGAIIKVFRIQ